MLLLFQVLHRVGNSIDIKVQFNPDKFCLEEDTESDQDDEVKKIVQILSQRSSSSSFFIVSSYRSYKLEDARLVFSLFKGDVTVWITVTTILLKDSLYRAGGRGSPT
jgi:hypothetical protein